MNPVLARSWPEPTLRHVRSRRKLTFGRNIKADRLRGLKIDDQLKAGRLLDRHIGGLGSTLTSGF
jgi:hypothetical protein